MGDNLPLAPGATGSAVGDLRRRLTELGWDLSGDPDDTYGTSTESAVRAFQADRGVEPTGAVDRTTWRALVEAGYRIGDRPLYHQRPMLRGEDVQELQIRLGSLGFDAGWVDGIFGPDTEHALKDFQRNAGLATDGIAGRATVGELVRLGAKSARSEPVAGVRERELLRQGAAAGLRGRRIVVGETGTMAALADAAGRRLRTAGARVVTLHDPDASTQAEAANTFDGDVYLGVTTRPDPGACVQFFAIEGFTSAGGATLADEVAARIGPVLGTEAVEVTGTKVAILRETRMPAVWCELGPPDVVVRQLPELVGALTAALGAWAASPLDR